MDVMISVALKYTYREHLLAIQYQTFEWLLVLSRFLIYAVQYKMYFFTLPEYKLFLIPPEFGNDQSERTCPVVVMKTDTNI